jgi:hypothetical protein
MTALHERFTSALASLVDQLQADRAVIGAILCGSLAHDTVWDKSDIDLVIVTTDEDRPTRTSITLDANGIHVHALVMRRAEFRQSLEGAEHQSFDHSFIAKGRVLFTHDPALTELHARLQEPGARDTRLQVLRAAVSAVCSLDKARKWLVTRRDLEYASLWLLYAATPIARIEVIDRSLIADREVVPQAAALNPALFRTIYSDLLNNKKTEAAVRRALETADGCIRERASVLFAPILDYLEEVGEARGCSELENHFARSCDVNEVTPACEYLAREGLIGQASLPARLTRRSSTSLPELAFFSVGVVSHGAGAR